jgi:hypothetical protein
MNDTWDSDDQRELERALRDEAADLRRKPRASVAERIVSALPECAGTRSRSPVSLGALAGRLAVAAAVAAGLYGLWTWDTVERAPVAPAPSLVAGMSRSGLELPRLGELDVTLPNPLLDEARRLGRDATSATGFLANKLPPTFRSALFSGF